MTSRTATATCDDSLRRSRYLHLTAFMAAVIVVFSAVSATAQQYNVLPIDPAVNDDGQIKKYVAAVKGYATSKSPTSYPGRQQAGTYLSRHLPTLLTQPDRLKDAGKLISEVVDAIDRGQRGGAPAANQVRDAFYRSMLGLTKGNFRPAVQISALVAITQLNNVPENRTTRTPPVPYSAALREYVSIYGAEGSNDGLKAVALKGLQRYVVMGAPISAAQSSFVVDEMKKLLNAPAPAGRSEKAHAYMQRFAVNILTVLSPADDPEFGTLLVSLSGDKDRHPLIALYSAKHIADAAKSLTGNVASPNELLESWAARAVKAYETELLRIDAIDKRTPATSQPPDPGTQIGVRRPKTAGANTAQNMEMEMGMNMDMDMDEGMDESMEMGMMDMDMEMEMGMGMGMGMMPGMEPEAKPQPPEVLASRRNLNLVLQQLYRGASGSLKPADEGKTNPPGGLLIAVAAPERPKVEAWITKVEEVAAGLNDDTLDDRKKFVEAITEQVETLRLLAGAAAETPVEIPGVLRPGMDRIAPGVAPADLPAIGAGDELAPASN